MTKGAGATESRAELRAIQESGLNGNDFYDTVQPRMKRMKSAATVKKQGRLARVGSEGNLTRNNFMSKKTADMTSQASNRDFTGPYKGISFRDLAMEYPEKQQSFDFHLKGMKVPITMSGK